MLNYTDVLNAYIVINQNKPELLEDFRKQLDDSEANIINGLLNVTGMMKAVSLSEDENKEEYITGNLLLGLSDLFAENIKLLHSISGANNTANFYLNVLPENQRTKILNISGE